MSKIKFLVSWVLLSIIIFGALLVLTGCDDGETAGNSVVTISAIPGVVVPVRSAVPDTTVIDTAQYTGIISWSPADNPFEAETEYTANIVLTAKKEYTLNGVSANFFTVAGAITVVNAVNSGEVTAVFPATGEVPDVDVTFESVIETGGTSGTVNSTGLILTFDVDPTTLTADNITVTGATKGALTDNGLTKNLAISNITVANGEMVSVTITSPDGYAVTGSPQTAVVYRYNTPITFQSAVQYGGTSGSADSTGLTLTFSSDPTILTADNITVTGAMKGTLTGTGTTRSLSISDIVVANGATVSITVTSPGGYAITGSPQTAEVYRQLTVGMDYLGGKIAHILEASQPGYEAGVPHGLIVSTENLSAGIIWALAVNQSTAVTGTDTAIGTGSANTDKIIAQNDPGGEGLVTYAAGLAREYNGGGYTDWYLPSQDELKYLYYNRTAIDVDFLSGDYWNSSEDIGTKAYAQSVNNGLCFSDPKSTLYKVRAFRSF